ncbi:DDE-type integrase/transposase/recombinase [Streptomyces sp. H27-D2]|uniref:DDE-type integrase/transposase/recombinase n=1 Tax=Streptomyces sp. H27-D2 TaxID=3046304 RepID=UPI003FA6860C
MTEIETGEGKLYLATVLDLFSRRLLGYAMGAYHDAALAGASLKMAAATRGGDVDGVIFHSDRGSEYTSEAYNSLCDHLGVVQSMGRVGSGLRCIRSRTRPASSHRRDLHTHESTTTLKSPCCWGRPERPRHPLSVRRCHAAYGISRGRNGSVRHLISPDRASEEPDGPNPMSTPRECPRHNCRFRYTIGPVGSSPASPWKPRRLPFR